MNPTTTKNLSNVITFDELMEIASELGSEAGKGKDTQIKFLLKAAEGGYHNALDLTKNKHGADVDDAQRLAEIYFKAQQGAVVFDAKADNQRKLASIVRTAIKVGGWPKGGAGEPLATINNLMTHRQNFKKVPGNAKRIDDAANTFLKYARAQLKRDALIEDDELKEFCFKPEKAEQPTAEELIERLVKQLDKLADGTAAGGTAQDNSTEVIHARQQLRKRLSALATARGQGAPAKPARGAKGAQVSP